MPPSTRAVRSTLMSNLKIHAAFSDEKIEFLKHVIVTADFLKQTGARGDVLAPGRKYYHQDGREHTFQDVPLEAVLEATEHHISCYVRWDRQSELCDKIFASVPSYKRFAERVAEPPPNPNDKPKTPFSTSRASPNFQKSNVELIDDLAFVTDMKPERMLFIREIITVNDGYCAKGCMLQRGTWKVSGGRLGRDHTFEDVPNCYVRDNLLDYINDELPAHQQQAVRRAVFSDLTDAELESYSSLLAQVKEQEEEEMAVARMPAKTPTVEEILSEARGLHHHLVTKVGEARNIMQEQAAIEAIDLTVSLTPGISTIRRSCDPISRSVIRPGSDMLPAEREIQTDEYINHTCDQIRAMVKRFVSTGSWNLHHLRSALGLTRPQLLAFLAKRGIESRQVRSKAFELCWEFFHRREKLGLPLDGAGPQRDEGLVQQRAAERRSVNYGSRSRGVKRPRTGVRG